MLLPWPGVSAGVYAATGARDKTLAIWHTEKGTLITTKKLDEVISDLAWHPAANNLVVVGEGGGVGVIRGVIPPEQGLPSAWRPVDELLRDADKAAMGEHVTLREGC